MSLADQVYNEVIKKVPTAIRKFGADALGSAIIKAIRSTDTTDIENLADEVIKSLNPKTNEEKNKPILTDDEEKRILSKLLKVFNSISSPEQLKSAKKYYNLALEKLHAKSLDEFYRERGEIGDLALKVSSMISNKEKKYTPVDEGQIYSTGGGCGQAHRKFTPKVDNTGISQESAIMKGLVGEGDVVPFKRRDWEALPQRVRQLSAEWYWAHSVEDGPEIDRLANQLATMGFDIDYDYDGENIELTNKKSNRKFLLSLEDADNFTGWAQGTEPGYDDLNENLRKWFKEKWVRFGPDGKIRGACARGSDSEGKPKCLPQKKAHALGKKGRKYAASKKRREDPNPERRGKAKNVATKKKSNEGVTEEQLDELKCWPGYTRVKGVKAGAPGSCKKKTSESTKLDEEYSWVIQHKDTKKVIGTFKNENDAVGQFNSILPEKRKKYVVKNVPHKHEQLTNENKHRKCPSCGGELVSEEMLNEKKDACYYKVKSRYKVWPSAYASGALVQCRKKGAKNWGKKSVKENKSSSMPGTYEQEYNMFKSKGPERIIAMTNEADKDVAEGKKRKKKKTSRSLGRYFFPGYGYYGSGESGESGSGDGGGGESVNRGVAEGEVVRFPGKSRDNSPLGTVARALGGKIDAEDSPKYEFDIEVKRIPQGWAIFRAGVKQDVYDDPDRAHEAAKEIEDVIRDEEEQLDELKCWPGHHRVKGTKAGALGSCAKNTSEGVEDDKCPHCGGELVSEDMLNEKKDACYYKVKSRYKVWPSAYASGALVKCRKVGAKNWGKSTTKENKGLSMPGTYEQEYNMFKKKGPERITAMTYENQSTTEVIGPFKLLDIKDDIVTVKGHEPLRLSRLSKDKLTPGFNYAFEVSGNDIIKVILMTVDTVIHTDDAILMIKRKNQPFADHWALPGGFIDPGETPLQAAIRELQEETGLQITSAEPVGEFKTANRDPRMENTWSYAFKLYVKDRATVKAGDDASAAKWVPINKISTLPVAFDHRDIIKKALSGQIDESSPDFAAMFEAIEQDIMQEKWSAKYKRSINCNNPKGFSQRAHCQGRKKKGKK